MAFFTKKTWRDRQVEHAGRRTLKNVSTNEETVVDVTRNEGQVSVPGNAFSASEMNDLESRIDAALDAAEEAIDGKLDGTGLTTDYNTVITVGAEDAAPANSVIKTLYQNFLDGCSRIAAAITGGRDGSGTGGVATASNASVATMTANIQAMASLNYSQGITFADSRVNTESASYNAGKKAYSVRSVALTGTRGSDETYTEFSFTVEAGRTLWVDLFPTVTNETYWVWGGDSPQGYPENSSGHAWSLSGTTLKCSCYRRRSMSCTVHYIN